MKIRTLLLALCLLSCFSCQQIVDNYLENRARENYTSPYEGTYAGTYSGAESGTLTVQVSRHDAVTVTRTPAQNPSETFYGALVGGTFSGVVSNNSGFTLQGKIPQEHNSAFPGTWKIRDTSGSWTLKKQ